MWFFKKMATLREWWSNSAWVHWQEDSRSSDCAFSNSALWIHYIYSLYTVSLSHYRDTESNNKRSYCNACGFVLVRYISIRGYGFIWWQLFFELAAIGGTTLNKFAIDIVDIKDTEAFVNSIKEYKALNKNLPKSFAASEVITVFTDWDLEKIKWDLGYTKG